MKEEKLKNLTSLVIEWGRDKGIFDESNPTKQYVKTQEEVSELGEAIKLNDKSLIIDALGDVMVTLILQAEMQNLDLYECLSVAYEEIKNRKGKMVNGLFVKEDDLYGSQLINAHHIANEEYRKLMQNSQEFVNHMEKLQKQINKMINMAQ